jgi:hypothetical protein
VRGRLALFAALALLAAGCGGGSSGGGGSTASDAASLVPADALGYIAANTDFSGGPLKSAVGILDKFPIKPKVLDQIKSGLLKQGIDSDALASSIGPVTDIAILDVDGVTSAVGFTQPKDEKTFDAQLDKGQSRAVHEKIDGWTVFADKQSFIDAVKNRKANLSDDAAYQAAAKTLPAESDAIATAYAAPLGIATATKAAAGSLPTGTTFGLGTGAKWATGALTSSDGAFKLELHTKSTTAPPAAPAASPLADKIPSGSIVALSLTGGSNTIPAQLRKQAAGVSAQLGFDVAGLLDALNGPVIAYVRAGLPLPEVTVAARPPEPARAAAAIGQLIARLTQNKAPAVPTPVAGGTLQKVDLGSVAIYYGTVKGELVATDSANAVSELNGSAGKLSGDAVFKEAKDGAGMPDASQGFLFVNLKDAVPAIQGFAQLANQTVPESIMANLRPLRSLLVYGSRDGDVQNVVIYLKTNP